MKRLIISILMIVLIGLAGCAGKNSGGTRDNPSKLEKSPCAGCFGSDEKERIGVKLDVS